MMKVSVSGITLTVITFTGLTIRWYAPAEFGLESLLHVHIFAGTRACMGTQRRYRGEATVIGSIV